MSDTVAPQEGKFYRTRDGRKVGPMRVGLSSEMSWEEHRSAGPDAEWGLDGKIRLIGPECHSDLVAEWTEGPVVTETVKRIVPGVYGVLGVGTVENGTVRVGFERTAGVYLPLTATELREAAETLTTLADALQES